MNDHILDLAKGFNGGTQADWQALAEKTLRGADFTEALVRTSEDGINRGPLFTYAPKNAAIAKAEAPHLAGRPWHITPVIDHPDIAHANKDILADLAGGASAFRLKIDAYGKMGGKIGGKNGIAVQSRSDMQRLLSGVVAHLVPIYLSPSPGNFEAAALLAGLFKNHSDLANIHLGFGYSLQPDAVDKSVSMAKWVRANAPHWKAFTVNAAKPHEAGASTAQELAYMLSVAVNHINALLAGDLEIDEILPLMDVHLAAPADGHWGICKLRAARMLWARMAQSYNASDTACTLHATTSRRMLSKLDPWSNMLRLGGATFGAVCGGADTITTLPFTEPLGLASPFARRIARNTQLLLMEESHLGQVNDPASGSYTHETLSEKIAQSAWGLFQELERRDGWPQAQDWFAAQIAKTAKHRAERIEDGHIKLVGVNQFTKPDVRAAKVLPCPEIKPKSGTPIDADDFADAIDQGLAGNILPAQPRSQLFKPVRLSEAFETGGTS